MEQFSTDQERFWFEEFGNEYTDRNQSKKLLASNTALFSKILNSTKNVNSVMEIGANVGLNLLALRNLVPDISLSAIEINNYACNALKKLDNIRVYNQSILDFESQDKYDFVLSKGVLIHLNPEKLQKVYDLMYKLSNKYICVVEYYNPTPVALNYRGHTDRLFKRNFAGEILDKFKDVSLVDYGFAYHRDKYFPQDDVTWFLLEKTDK